MVNKYSLPPLPYKHEDLEPTITREILTLHHDKHHAAYVNGANAALDKLEQARKSGVTDVTIRAIERDLAFNASGHVLHSMYWTNMKKGGGRPGGQIADMIQSDLGGFEAFKQQFGAATKNVEGSGWGILAYDPTSDQLVILQAENHQHLTLQGSYPILVCDAWEHAYYLQYKNDRGAYVDAWWNVVNWDDVEKRVSKRKM
jgi:Fe-Mn family superoxide dismutase